MSNRMEVGVLQARILLRDLFEWGMRGGVEEACAYNPDLECMQLQVFAWETNDAKD